MYRTITTIYRNNSCFTVKKSKFFIENNFSLEKLARYIFTTWLV